MANCAAPIVTLAVDFLTRVVPRWRLGIVAEDSRVGPKKTEQELQPKVHGMERSSKRGKIPQQDWPSIINRYEAGETLASIARTYDCSPPAISYIVSRSRARDATAEGTPPDAIGPSEPQLVKGHGNEMPTAELSRSRSEVNETTADNVEAETSNPVEQLRTEPRRIGLEYASNDLANSPDLLNDLANSPDLLKDSVTRQDNAITNRRDREKPDAAPPGDGSTTHPDSTAGAMPQNGEVRRTLHLALSQDAGHPFDAQHQAPGRNPSGSNGPPVAGAAGGQQQGFLPPGPQSPGYYAPTANGGANRMMAEAQKAKDVGAFIDQALRERVDGDIAAFLAAFDAALSQDTLESRAGLREATDRLLRAGARTRIELERLEARIPLPPRDKSAHTVPVWRSR